MTVELHIDPGLGDIPNSAVYGQRIITESISSCAEDCVFFDGCDTARINAGNDVIEAASAARRAYDKTGDEAVLREALSDAQETEKQRLEAIKQFVAAMPNCPGWMQRLVETSYRPNLPNAGALGELAVATHHRTVKVCKNPAAERVASVGVRFPVD